MASEASSSGGLDLDLVIRLLAVDASVGSVEGVRSLRVHVVEGHLVVDIDLESTRWLGTGLLRWQVPVGSGWSGDPMEYGFGSWEALFIEDLVADLCDGIEGHLFRLTGVAADGRSLVHYPERGQPGARALGARALAKVARRSRSRR